MNASKEEAQSSNKSLNRIIAGTASSEDYEQLTLFLAAAEKRLPSEAAIERDKKRKRKPKPVEQDGASLSDDVL